MSMAQKLKITEEEDEIIVIDDDGKKEVSESFVIVGKIFTKRQIKMALVGEALQNIWQPVGGMTVEEMPDNTIIFRLGCRFERTRILNEGPWHFEKQLVVLKELDEGTSLYDFNFHECEFWVQIFNVPYSYLTKHTAENLGKGLGKISKIYVDSEGNVKGQFIRIKVIIDVDKPLKRIIKSVMGGKGVTLNLKYEKLENCCYACGKMDHVLSECDSPLQYGPWLRAHNYPREVKEGIVDKVKEDNVDEVKEVTRGNFDEVTPCNANLVKDVNVDERNAALHLRKRLKQEQHEQEQKKKENAEAHLYTVIKVARDEDLLQQIGRDVLFDLVDHDKVTSFRVRNELPFVCFKDELAREFGVPVHFQRFWIWGKRNNHTYRPIRPLTRLEENQCIEQLRELYNKVHNRELKLFLEIDLCLDLLPVTLPPKTNDDILLFFKLYDPWKEELSYLGRLFVKVVGKPIEILTKLNEMAGYTPDEEIELYEEIKFQPNVMCQLIDKKISFQSSELVDGDIVFIHKSLPAERRQQFRYPDVPSFLEYMHNR